MCVLCGRREETVKEAESRKLADASYVIQLTALKKFTYVYTCIQIRKVYFMNVRRQKKSKELKRCLNILQNVSVWR